LSYAILNYDLAFQKVIDYLKMDVEQSEWLALEAMFAEGFLSKYVKQIGIEYHTAIIRKTPERYFRILETLEKLGFQKWNVDWNMRCNPEITTKCYEVYYINTNFLSMT